MCDTEKTIEEGNPAKRKSAATTGIFGPVWLAREIAGLFAAEKGSTKGKGRDIGYALAASSCEGANNVEYAPSRPLMRSLLSQFQTPTTPRRAVGFFGSGRSPGRPSELITQLTLDWPLFILTNPFSRRRGQR
jgi:hypothetical protein